MSDAWISEKMRGDGLALETNLEGNWIILPRDDAPALDLCPCCNMPFRTAASAKRMADIVYPPEVRQ